MSKYRRITVHEDVFQLAQAAISSLTKDLPYEDERAQALRDLIDPLPEEDTFGVTPRVERLSAAEAQAEDPASILPGDGESDGESEWGEPSPLAQPEPEPVKQFTVLYYSISREHQGSIHRSGCSDIEKDRREHGASKVNVVGTLQDAIAAWLDDEMEEMGYSEADIKVLPCAKS